MFSRSFPLYSNFILPQTDFPRNEDERISYWLKKLHKLPEEQTFPRYNHFPPQLQESTKTLKEIGQDEQIKNQAVRDEADRESIDQLVKSSNRCIISISSNFLWNLFPTTINVEESRVTFIFRQFLSSQSHSVDIKDISNVFIESSLFSATLQIVSKTYIQNDIKIGNLNKKQAVKARMIIEGLRTLASHNLNTSSYQIPELISKIEEMHSSQGGQIE